MIIKKFIDSIDYLDIIMSTQHLDFVNDNYYLYTSSAAKKGIHTWLEPCSKPMLTNHDSKSDAVGRILKSSIKSNPSLKDEPEKAIELEIRISDKEAIEKVLTKRYYTGSVGSSAKKVTCSFCDNVITENGLCDGHFKGDVVDNERVYWIIDELTYSENSFVNKPADKFHRIVAVKINGKYINYEDLTYSEESLNEYLNLDYTNSNSNTELNNDTVESEMNIIKDLVDFTLDGNITDESINKFISDKKTDSKTITDSIFNVIKDLTSFYGKLTDESKKDLSDLIKPKEVVTVDAESEKLIESLKKEIVTKDEQLLQKEDELTKLIDKLAESKTTITTVIIDNIIDLKKISKNITDEEITTIKDGYKERKIDSLTDTLNDLRSETSFAKTTSITDTIADPTIRIEDENKVKTDEKFSVFYQ